MNNEINPIEEDFNAALSRYKAGQDLIPIVQDFQKIIQQIPIHFAAWTCLSWLQLLLINQIFPPPHKLYLYKILHKF